MATYRHFFDAVAVIESLNASEVQTGTRLFCDVIQIQAQAGSVLTSFRTVASRSELFRELDRLSEWSQNENHSPILHIECHGNPDGLQIGRDFVVWAELKPRLIGLNVATRLNLFVCLAACDGSKMIKLVTPQDRAPVWGMVGPKGTLTACELQVDYERFYTSFLKERDGWKALEALNGCPVGPDWRYGFRPAQYFFKEVYKTYRRNENSPAAIEQRANRIAKGLAEIGGLRGRSEDEVAATARAMLENDGMQAGLFRDMHSNFFMLDLFAENAERFSLTYAEVHPGE